MARDVFETQSVANALRAACEDLGVIYREVKADDRWHPADVETGKGGKHGKGDARIKLFSDGEGGIVANWQTSETRTFFYGDDRQLSPEDRAARDRKRAAAREEAEAKRLRNMKAAATRAEALTALAEPAFEEHPYLRRKACKVVPTLLEMSSDNVRRILGYAPSSSGEDLEGMLLIAPIRIGGDISSAEFIDEDGRKSAVANGDKKGGYWATAPLPTSAGTLILCEGVATALTLAQETDLTAVAALHAGNFERVAHFLRKRYPEAIIIVASDDDWQTNIRGVPTNVGLIAAKAAAKAIGGLLAVPSFDGSDRESGDTDFNDVACRLGRGAVKQQIAAACAIEQGQPDRAQATGKKKRPPGSGAVEAMKAAADDPRPVIQLVAGRLAFIADEAEQYLIEAKVLFYRRGDNLVRPIIDAVPATGDRETRTPRLKVIDNDYLRLALCRHIRWEKFDKRCNDFVAAEPSRDVGAVINARCGEWRFPAITGVIGTPTLRWDGSLLVKPGYDARTGLLLVDPPELPDMPDRPSRDDALDALVLLKELLIGFPFVPGSSLSVALSALITPVVRGGLEAAPMHVTTAPLAGSGKSYLFDVAAAISIGQLCPVMAAGKTEEEMEKRLGAALMSGQPIISIDNVNGELGGQMLCQAIERPVVEPRILGKSERAQVQNRATFFATGNNIRVVGDMTRRVVLCLLDSGQERPELREFGSKPAQIVLADRGPYIAACLNVVRAYHVAGCPGRLPALASFERWSDTVRSALVWLGEADPVESMKQAREDDPQRAEINAFLHAFAEEVGVGAGFRRTTPQIIRVIEAKAIEFRDGGGMREGDDFSHPLLREAVLSVSASGKPAARQLGNWLAKHANSVHGAMKLKKVEDANHGHKWYVDTV